MTFDPAKNYVIAAAGLYAGHTLTASHDVTILDEPTRPGEFTPAIAEQLYDAGKLMLADDVRPTPVERPEDAVVRLADLEHIEDEKFLIRAPWLDEAETVTGADEAKARLLEVHDLGLEAYRAAETAAGRTLSPANAGAVAAATIAGDDGFSIIENGSNGYYDIVAPGKEPERVRGKTAAEKRLAELRVEAATPPIDTTVDSTVNGDGDVATVG